MGRKLNIARKVWFTDCAYRPMRATSVRKAVYMSGLDESGELLETYQVEEIIFNGSTITEIKDASGSWYKIESFHPEYEELMRALQNGEPVLQAWNLSRVSDGYKIVAKMPFGEDVSGIVIAQEGNYVTIKREGGGAARFLVCWPRMSVKTLEELSGTGRIAGLDTENSFSLSCRPIIPC